MMISIDELCLSFVLLSDFVLMDCVDLCVMTYCINAVQDFCKNISIFNNIQLFEKYFAKTKIKQVLLIY